MKHLLWSILFFWNLTSMLVVAVVPDMAGRRLAIVYLAALATGFAYARMRQHEVTS